MLQLVQDVYNIFLRALTHAKYTALKGRLPPSPHAHTVSYCVWESSGIWRAETLSGDLWPPLAERRRLTWGSLGDFQVTQRTVSGLWKDHCVLCVQGLLCLSIRWSTVISNEQQTCFLYFNTTLWNSRLFCGFYSNHRSLLEAMFRMHLVFLHCCSHQRCNINLCEPFSLLSSHDSVPETQWQAPKQTGW